MMSAGELLRAGWTAGVTVTIVLTVLLVLGFWMLARRNRRGNAHAVTSQLERQQHANILLVRLDEAVIAGEQELDFAVAQFGAQQTRDYAAALSSARGALREAFRLQQALDDAKPDTERERREWTSRIMALCENAQAALAAETERFDELRRRERQAPQDLAQTRELIDRTRSRRPLITGLLAELESRFAPTAWSPVAGNAAELDDALVAADEAAAKAESALEARQGGQAIAALREATEQAHRGTQLADAVEAFTAELDRADAALSQQLSALDTELARARTMRDAPPDAAAIAAGTTTATEAIAAAIAEAERSLAALDERDPFPALEKIQALSIRLDGALASARNQQQRLDGARTALTGALAAAHSQLAVAREAIAAGRGRVGAQARTRIAEAERLLALAEAEADPLRALDTARSATTFARDADALARYDLLH